MNAIAAPAPVDASPLAWRWPPVLVIIGILVAAVLAAAFWRPHAGPAAAAPDFAKLDRLPARPADIEAHGSAARSLLAPDRARQTNSAVPFAAGALAAAKPFVLAGSDEDRTRAVACLSTAVLYEAGDDRQ